MFFRKENEGITLISLVITIIVLLILAGITIATLTGDNGILTKTNEAKEQTEIGKEKEIVKLATTAVITTNNAIDKDSLQSELNKMAGDKKTEVYNYNQKLQVYFTDSKRYYEIDKNFNIELINVTNGEKRISLKCINSKKEVLKEIEIITLNDNSIIEPPEIEKYEPSESSFSKTITQDTEIDILYYKVREDCLKVMHENPEQNINQGVKLLFVARYLERIGDHITNVCEKIIYARNGKMIEIG